MPTSYIWAVSSYGKIYRLATSEQRWLESRRKWQRVRGFKRVTAVQDCAWAIGSNLQLYVYVHKSDVPIRYQEVTYENERWNPVTGFSGQKLLPNDRWHWSDEAGSECRPQSGFKLPTDAWEWEDRWYVDENLNGELTSKGGWQYALDFRAQYHAHPRWNSFVRRRKWIRYRRYVATDCWTKVPDVHFDPTVEPIIDVSIGGAEIPHSPRGSYSVWAVTLLGKVVYRREVRRESPEGTCWDVVPIDNRQEVVGVSVGPTGLVWCIQWDGQALVRCGVCWDNPIGTHWVEVPSPGSDYKLSQASVGVNVVWAVSREGKVWFRKQVQALQCSDEKACTGSSWLEMVGEMGTISVGCNDQVWAIGLDEKCVYYRTGVHVDDLCGKTWRPIHLDKERRFPLEPDLPLVAEDQDPQQARSVIEVPLLPPTVITTTHGGSLPTHVLGRTISNESDSKNESDKESDAYVDDILKGKESSSSGELTAKPNDLPTTTRLVRDHSYEILTTSPLEETKVFVCNNCGSSDHGTSRCTKIDAESESSAETNASNCDTTDSGVSEPTPTKSDAKSNCGTIFSRNHDKTYPSDCLDLTITLTKSNNHRVRFSPNEDSGCGSCSQHQTRSDSISSTTSDTMINFVEDFEESEGEENAATNPNLTLTDLNRSGDYADITNDFRSVSFKSIRKDESTPLSFMPVRIPQRDDSDLQAYKPSGDEVHRSFEDEFDYDDAEYEDKTWVWVSGSGCTLDPMVPLPWFSAKDTRRDSLAPVHVWRLDLLSRLRVRNKRETTGWPEYPQAIERASWMKKGSMQWWRDDKREKWTECSVELELGLDKGDGFFTVQYTAQKKQKHVQVLLSDIVCTWTINDPTHQPVLGIYTAPRIDARIPIKLRTRTEEELEDWVTVVSLACCDLRGTSGAPASRSIWSCTARGDVFVHEPRPTLDGTLLEQLFWHQLGGHMRMVETCSSGVVWGLGYDNTAWVYTGGYGGGIFKGLASSATGNQPVVDRRQMYIYENQLWNPVTGYSYKTLPFYRAVWSDRSGRHEFTKENYTLPSRHWLWTSDWRIDLKAPGGTDKEGWQYARDFSMEYHGRRGWNDYVRRRRWSRECKITTSGPWREVGNIALLDVSVQVDADPDVQDDAIAVWAVSQNGDVMCRCNVTKRNPEGSSWRHVATDQPFLSVSIGGNYRVWAIASDGSPWFRNGVTRRNIAGTCWFHATLPPGGQTLKQISAGLTAVWAVDTKNQLWYRRHITKTYPEGTEWVFVCSGIRQVSVGPKDQVWVIAENVPSIHGPVNGVVCRRMGINRVNPMGTRWDQGIGGGWQHVSVRGCCGDREEEAYTPDVAAIDKPTGQWGKQDSKTLVC